MASCRSRISEGRLQRPLSPSHPVEKVIPIIGCLYSTGRLLYLAFNKVCGDTLSKALAYIGGKEYLSGVQLSELEETYRREYAGKSKDRLQAVVLRKRGRVLKDIARILGRGISTIYRWLYRMERKGLEHRYSTKSPCMPRLLSPEQECTIKGDIDRTPRECGFELDSWNTRILARHTLERFGVQYSSRSAIRLAHQPNYSIRYGDLVKGGQLLFLHPVR